METKSEYYKRMNQETPIMPVRMPSPKHHDQVREAAATAGVTVSEWVRQAVARALEESMVPTAK